MFDMSREMDVGVSLYSRKVMIMSKANHILPRWLRFLKGEPPSKSPLLFMLSRQSFECSGML